MGREAQVKNATPAYVRARSECARQIDLTEGGWRLREVEGVDLIKHAIEEHSLAGSARHRRSVNSSERCDGPRQRVIVALWKGRMLR